MAILIPILVIAAIALFLIIRAEPKEDRAGDRELRWYRRH